MPTSGCHPIAPHCKLRIPDWYVSSLMLERSLDAILRRVRLIRSYDIPYLAGYSQNGKTIYIDRHLPQTFVYRGKAISVDRYLILHEIVEKALIDEAKLHYLHAHQIATRAEEAAVRADKISWRAYDRFMQLHVKTIGSERLTRVPVDLDLKPYRDEHDQALLAAMARAQANGILPPGVASRRLLQLATGGRAAIVGRRTPKAATRQRRRPVALATVARLKKPRGKAA